MRAPHWYPWFDWFATAAQSCEIVERSQSITRHNCFSTYFDFFTWLNPASTDELIPIHREICQCPIVARHTKRLCPRVPFLACPLCDPCDKGDAISAPAAECSIQGIKPFSSASAKIAIFFCFVAPSCYPRLHNPLRLACYPIDRGEASTVGSALALLANAGATCGGCCPFLHFGGLSLQFAASSLHLSMILRFSPVASTRPTHHLLPPNRSPLGHGTGNLYTTRFVLSARPKCFPFGEPP